MVAVKEITVAPRSSGNGGRQQWRGRRGVARRERHHGRFGSISSWSDSWLHDAAPELKTEDKDEPEPHFQSHRLRDRSDVFRGVYNQPQATAAQLRNGCGFDLWARDAERYLRNGAPGHLG